MNKQNQTETLATYDEIWFFTTYAGIKHYVVRFNYVTK